MEQIVWRPVANFEGRYEVSNEGKVRSVDIYLNGRGGKKRLCKGKIKPLHRNNRGYVVVNLCKDGKTSSLLVHRLVAEAFVPNTRNKPQVNHIDGNITNNRADNLEWVTDNENKAHSSITTGGTQRPKRAVVLTKVTTGKSIIFAGLREAERALDLDHGSTTKVLKGKQQSHHGYYIAYADGGDA